MLGARASLLGWLAFALPCTACGRDNDDDGAQAQGGTNAQGGNASRAGSGNTPKAGSSSGGSPSTGEPTTTGDTFGEAHEGVYHLGPVDFEETEWHNACAPGGSKYRSELRETVGLSGEFLAAVANKYNDGGGVCDACILIETGMGKSIVARVVTYGVQQADGDIDVSPTVFEAIHQNESPRSQTWRFARCPEAGNLQYEFQTEAHQYWSSLWVRNPRVPLTRLEVKSANHADFIEMARAGDGSLTDASGFGEGPFTFRLTALDGQVLTDEITGFKPGQLVKSAKQFK